MAYDFLSGQFGATRGSGFAGRATGSRFANIYGYNNGEAVTDQNQWNQLQQQQQQQLTNPGASNNFFSQLAGLMGPQQSAQAPAKNPNVGYWSQTGLPASAASKAINRYQPPQVRTDGGVGPYGGISEANRRNMFLGRLRGIGMSQSSPYRAGGVL